MIHIFVDYENIKRIDPAVFTLEGATFTLLLGPQNRTLNVALVEQLMERAAAVELVRLEEAGRNAVDFALAYYLGRKVVTDPTAQFYLISKDTGYDPLIAHLRGRKVRVRRMQDFEGLNITRDATASLAARTPAGLATAKGASTLGRTAKKTTPVPEKVIATIDPIARVLAHLRKNPNNRPRRQTTLMRHLASQLHKGETDEEIERFVGTLVKGGYLEIDPKGSITYRLDDGSA
jgi:hypothetical protein